MLVGWGQEHGSPFTHLWGTGNATLSTFSAVIPVNADGSFKAAAELGPDDCHDSCDHVDPEPSPAFIP